jgi:protein-glutamine gamma-glutamyltransferase
MGRTAIDAAQPVEQFFQYSLLGLLASGYFAVLGSGYLDLPAAVLAGVGLLVRALLVSKVIAWNISANWTNAATIAYMGFYPIDYLYLSREFIPATVHLVFFLAVVRILTAKSNRDYFFVKVIAFLELLAATLLSSSVNFFIFLTLFVVFGVATLCCSEIRRSAQMGGRIVAGSMRFHRRLAALAASITMGIVLMTAGLFFMLPRTARAAFSSFVSQRYHLPGFSNEITLGEIGVIKQQSTPVMRVRIEGPGERVSRKWRGAALTQFDGKRWYNPPATNEKIILHKGHGWLVDSTQLSRTGKRLQYEVKINAVDSDALFFTGQPESVLITLPLILRSIGDSYRTAFASSDGSHYVGTSYIGDAPGSAGADGLAPGMRNELLLLPPTDPRILELSKTIGGPRPAREQALAIEKHLRTGYAYTMDLLTSPVKDPLAHFLFTRRKGHCEYFASAMAVMLRAIHIPSRVVTGFQGGTFNPMTGWHVIRASDAHSWVEAYLPGQGWTEFDPTPPDTSPRTAGLWSQWDLYVDASDLFWQQWVMNYNLDQQLSLASRVEESSRVFNTNWIAAISRSTRSFARDGWKSAEPYAVAGVALVLLIGLGIWCGPRCWRAALAYLHARRLSRGQIGASDAAILYCRMLDILRRRGYEKPGWLTPSEFARILPPSPMAASVASITALYNDLRYARRPGAGVRILELLKELETCR